MNHSNKNISSNNKSVLEPVDSIIEVYISNNKLEASVNIKPPQNGGIGPNILSLKEALASNNIIHGINMRELLDISKEPRYNMNILVARGTFPINGVDGSFQIHFDTMKDSKPKEKEDGSVDYYNLENVENVKIKVAGNVIISGGVLPGFTVEATGNIQIHNGLSAVTLIAGGDIILRGGVIGGNLTCEGDLTSKFIENCRVFVKGDIKTDYVMNSEIRCGKNLHATNPISKIVGGKYLVGENIEANIIGSNANVKTYLELGTDPSTIKRQHQLTKEIPLLKTKKDSLESLISLLQQFETNNRLTLEKKLMLEKALFSYNEITELIIDGESELEKITQSIKSKGYGRVICKGIIHSGTTVKIGSVKATIHETIFAKSLYYSEEGIRIGNA